MADSLINLNFAPTNGSDMNGIGKGGNASRILVFVTISLISSCSNSILASLYDNCETIYPLNSPSSVLEEVDESEIGGT
jgi:hypothetical protein